MPFKNTQVKLHEIFSKSFVLVVAFSLVLALCVVPKTHALVLNNSSIVEIAGTGSPMIAGAGNQLVVAFQPITAGAQTSFSVNLTAGWTGATGVVNTTQSVSATSCTTYFPSATALPLTTATGSGTTITVNYTSTTLSTSTTYCGALTSTTAVTNPTAGVYQPVITSGADSSTVAVDILSSGANAYSVTVSVLPTFTMSLSSTTDSFTGNSLSASVNASSGVTATVSTNATSGWFLWAKDTNSGLLSAHTSHNIPSVASCVTNSSLSNGTEAYALGVATNNTPNYAYTGATHGGCLSSSTYYQIATSASPANAVTSVMHELATISPVTPAAPDYTDTITVIGAGSF